MKILIVSPYATVAPHFETELEIAQEHLDRGDEVRFLSCTGQLANCDFNTEKCESRCKQCAGRREMGMEFLDPLVEVTSFVPLNSLSHKLESHFASLQELTGYRIDNFDIGYAALSSLVSVCRDPEPDLEQWQPMLERLIHSAWQVYTKVQNWIDENQPDRVYNFNGRFAAMRAVLRACESRGVDCFIHERGCDLNHYEIFENHLPHEIESISATIHRMWDGADPAVREKVGASWFTDRVERIERSWHSFTKQQTAGLLPIGFDEKKKNIAIFTTSDDEFVAIGDSWRNTTYPNQVEAIQKIAASMRLHHPEIHLYVRVHPNLIEVDNARKREMLALTGDNLTIINPEATVDTYALMRGSWKTATFGSTVGLEAVFWGKPSVLLGPSLYQNLVGPYRSGSHDQTIELFGSELEPSDDKTGALMYGYWLQARGRRYKHYEAKTLFEGKFKGEVLYDRTPFQKKSRWKQVSRAVAGVFNK